MAPKPPKVEETQRPKPGNSTSHRRLSSSFGGRRLQAERRRLGDVRSSVPLRPSPNAPKITKMTCSTDRASMLPSVQRSPIFFNGTWVSRGPRRHRRGPPVAGSSQTCRRRLTIEAVRPSIRILLLALAILAPVIASTAAPSYAETRVWGFEFEEPARARAETPLSQTCIEGYPSAYDGFVVGCSPVPRETVVRTGPPVIPLDWDAGAPRPNRKPTPSSCPSES